ncbi:uncharacterized protein LOC119126161 [Syngnathus acus]|uniref:uncharacterized protein LOC119126161 n=1 Tax=Syngnathus acus TaxID=161584 RepID=UPI001885C72E|nr:uncharacterized protein LOC119126161 [Syngnathus acus]
MSPRNALLFVFHPAGAVRPAPHVRQLLLREGNVEENPGPIYCPGCSKTIRHDFIPLVCIACRRSFHRTCSGLTRAQKKSHQGFLCGSCPGNAVVPSPTRSVYVGPKVSRLEDPTPQLPGLNAIRQDREGSGTKLQRDGGLLIYLRSGIPYSILPSTPSGSLELQHLHIPIARRRHLSLVNAYIPPVTSEQCQIHQDSTWLSTEKGLICGDFNAHHTAWDEFAKADPRGNAIHQWVDNHDKTLLNELCQCFTQFLLKLEKSLV